MTAFLVRPGVRGQATAVVVAGLAAALAGCVASALAPRLGWWVPALATIPVTLLLVLRDRFATATEHRLQAELEPALWDLVLDPAQHELRRIGRERRAAATSLVSRLRTLVGAALLDALLALATVSAAFVVLCTVDARLAFAFGGVTAGLLVVMAWQARGVGDESTNLLDAVLAGTDEIHLYAAERRMLTKLLPREARAKTEPRLAALAALTLPVLLAIVLGTARANDLPVACVVLVQLVLVLGRPDNTVRSVLVVGAEAVRGAKTLLAKATPVTRQSTNERLKGEIEVVEVSYDRAPTLRNLHIAAGEFVAVTGASGAGKTSLLKLLGGLEVAQCGEVRHDGARRRLADIRDHIGYVTQDADVPRGNVRSVVLGRTSHDDEKAWQALEKSGLAGVIRNLPMGLSTVVAGGAGGFSRSQLQLMLYARALARGPRILLFDEPPDTAAEALRDHEGVTRVVVTHSPRLLRAADRVVVLGPEATNTETHWGQL
jgi:ABC-type multidrug transport system fused ATPase/permease subunit